MFGSYEALLLNDKKVEAPGTTGIYHSGWASNDVKNNEVISEHSAVWFEFHKYLCREKYKVRYPPGRSE